MGGGGGGHIYIYFLIATLDLLKMMVMDKSSLWYPNKPSLQEA